jgi:hypothetical protein
LHLLFSLLNLVDPFLSSYDDLASSSPIHPARRRCGFLCHVAGVLAVPNPGENSADSREDYAALSPRIPRELNL